MAFSKRAPSLSEFPGGMGFGCKWLTGFGSRAMPTFLMIKDGKVVDQIVGAALDKLLLSVTNNK